ncbi:MAG: hypothetical protein N2487_01975, partial [Verrucomicrobiae bacterium]|nr:hypothetical protein [Verrucomicrobiae bacterium]
MKRFISITVFFILYLEYFEAISSERLIDAPIPQLYRVWISEPPEDCPFKQSAALIGIGFTGRHAEYTGADTWYPCWASDDNLYSPWTDGSVNGLNSNSSG